MTFDITTSLLPRAHRALHDRVDDFEMRGIERQYNVYVASRCLHVRRKSLVVLDVTRALELFRIVLALEFFEQFLCRLTKDVDEYVNAATMCHTDNDFMDACRPALMDQVVKHWDQAVTAFERKTLLSNIARVQITLDTFGARQLLQDHQTFVIRQRIRRDPLFESIAQP